MGKVFNGKTIPFMAIAGFLIGYGVLQAQVQGNKAAISKVEETPIKVAVIQTDLSYIKEDVLELKDDFGEFRLEQRTISNKIDKLLEKIQ
jgi:hypothetical protein